MRLWIAFALAAAALFLSVWIYLPAPTYFLLNFSVGAPEVAHWIVVAALTAVVLSVRDSRQPFGATIVAMGVVAAALGATPFARFPSTARAFADSTRAMSAEPASPIRTSSLSVLDLFRGIPGGDSTRVDQVSVSAAEAGSLRALVYRPVSGSPHPMLVQIYGGAWQRGAPGDNANFARLLAGHGWIVIAVDYRHAPSARWPAQYDDVRSALEWTRDHAAEIGGDTSKVVLMGRSAGAHLALMAAFRNPPLRVRGVVAYYAPVDLTDAYANPPHPDPLDVRDVERTLIGGPPSAFADRYADASPISYASRPQPPTLLVFGARDNIVERRYGRRLHDALRAGGSQTAYLEIPWAGHAFDAVFNGPSAQLALYHVERFLTWAVR